MKNPYAARFFTKQDGVYRHVDNSDIWIKRTGLGGYKLPWTIYFMEEPIDVCPTLTSARGAAWYYAQVAGPVHLDTITCEICHGVELSSKPTTRGPVSRLCSQHKQEHERQLKSKHARVHRLKKFNITPAQWEALYARQNRGCAGCNRPKEANGKRLAVDHCHTTGAVRGLLCYKCNSVLGHVGDDPAVLRRLITYLTSPPAASELPQPSSAGLDISETENHVMYS